MPVYKRHRLVHIHIPKTAGTAIENLFHGLGDMEGGPKSLFGRHWRDGRWFEFQHLTYRELVSLTGFRYTSFQSFAVVRNPYQRFLSDYVWHIGPPRNRFESVSELFRRIPRDISERWDDLIREADWYTANILIHARPQNHYVYDATGRLLVDSLLRFEHLAEGLSALLEPHGLSSSFVRPIRERRLSKFLRRDQIQLINELYALDFERFGYEKID